MSSYHPAIVAGLGLVTLEYSRMEAAAQDILALLITPHQFVGEMAVAGENLSTSIQRARALVHGRLADGSLRAQVLEWLSEVDSAREQRNSFVHARWLSLSITAKVAVRKGQLTHAFRDVTADDLRNLARRMWSLHQEGLHLRIDLAVAGLGNVTRVSADSEERVPASAEYQVKGTEMLGRPDPPPRWPGEALMSRDGEC